mmetsp:Transcript_45403/g.140300  ORF Transcript_45403/g.140300 Transcript_45403/m.140300 type:complete len:236 (+) Transcript_45403:339-1046(+)
MPRPVLVELLEDGPHERYDGQVGLAEASLLGPRRRNLDPGLGIGTHRRITLHRRAHQGDGAGAVPQRVVLLRLDLVRRVPVQEVLHRDAVHLGLVHERVRLGLDVMQLAVVDLRLGLLVEAELHPGELQRGDAADEDRDEEVVAEPHGLGRAGQRRVDVVEEREHDEQGEGGDRRPRRGRLRPDEEAGVAHALEDEVRQQDLPDVVIRHPAGGEAEVHEVPAGAAEGALLHQPGL